MKTIKTGLKKIAAGLLPLSMAATALPALAETAPVTDCPFRDLPFSLDSPLIDLLLSEKAYAAVKAAVPSIEKFPEHMIRTETPSFASILNARSLVAMTGASPDTLQGLEEQLADIEVTDGDRRARCARYDNEKPEFDLPEAPVNLLVFDKINGFDHGPSVDAATDAIKQLGGELGWAVAVTDKGGAFNADTLAQFDAVIWNNVSGDVLTLSQREAFQDYLNQGGGFVGIHGSGGDPSYFWGWYADELLGARFIGHPMNPQFQDAELNLERTPGGIDSELPEQWVMKDEWYSFAESPRLHGANIVAVLDEGSYDPGNAMGKDLHMGEDHPIVWTRCIGEGRSFYTGIGHRPEVYAVEENLDLLKTGLRWAADKSVTCDKSPAGK